MMNVLIGQRIEKKYIKNEYLVQIISCLCNLNGMNRDDSLF